MFHPGWRELALSQLDRPVDLLVVGGGITGCGVALDAAQRGLSVLLVERGDLASGTSSRSSKLIHGGLRYLKEMQLRVTRLACRERDRMMLLSPHLVQPLPFVYPASHGDRLPGWKVDLGLWMYDRLTRRPEKHRRVGGAEVRELVPGLSTDDLAQAFLYGDALADDARLTLAVAATAFAFGARVLTRAEIVEGRRGPDARVIGAILRDLESGATHTVTAGVVVNATGVWVDTVRERLGFAGRRVRPSRGSHLILARERLPVHAAVTLPSPDDARPVFVIPHPEGTLVGTTDLYHEGSLDDPRAAPAEVRYLLRTLETHFPERRLSPADVRGTFAGVRPILQTEAENPSEASREEAVWDEDGLLSVAGGKLTTWRPTAEAVVDRLVDRLPPARRRAVGPCLTAGTPLAGVAPLDLPERLAARGVAPHVAAGMARRLAGTAWTALELAGDRRALEPLVAGSDLCAAEVRGHLRYGAVVRLEDLLLRRVRIGMWSPELVGELLPALAPLCRAELGWSAKRWEQECAALDGAVAGWRPVAPA